MRKYSSVDIRNGCRDYQGVADIMTLDGDPMSFSTARNHFLKGMKTVALEICEAYQINIERADKIALNPEFQMAVAGILRS